MSVDLSRRAALGGALAALAAQRAPAQGFAGMGQPAPEYGVVSPGRALRFPEDHFPHPDYRIEWWYVTVVLEDETGASCGAQFTLFRNAFAPGPQRVGWENQQIWMAHAAVTTADAHHATERFARGGVGQAGVRRAPFAAWIDDWALESRGGVDPYDAMRMRATGPGFSYDLTLDAEGPLIAHGEGGYSRKSERGQASYYYSQPFYRAAGTLTIDGMARHVTGDAWLDREWSSQPLDPDQTGWDWFSLSFESGDKLMLYRMRQEFGDDLSGTWIHPDGRTESIAKREVGMRPTRWVEVAGRETPVDWRIALPARKLEIETVALNAQSWNGLTIPYWEGPVIASGTHPGRGYLEMTGY